MFSHEGENHMQEAPKTERKILTADDIREHIGSPTGIDWVAAGDLTQGVAESCVDGRERLGVISTAGGNAGEFVLAVQAAEEVSGKQLSEVEIMAFFKQYLDRFGAFYMHTDEHALHHVGEVLAGDAKFSRYDLHSTETVLDLVGAPPVELQADLLNHLTNPDTMGCGHLKLMIKDSAEYGIRPEIVQAMVKAYYQELWQGNKGLEFVILPGDHEEGAVVLVTSGEEAFDANSQVPTVAPLANGTSFFANHPQAIEYLRRTTADQIVADELLPEMVTTENLTAYKEKLQVKGKHLLEKTVAKLAVYATTDEHGQQIKKPLPIFTVHFTSPTEFTVDQVA